MVTSQLPTYATLHFLCLFLVRRTATSITRGVVCSAITCTAILITLPPLGHRYDPGHVGLMCIHVCIRVSTLRVSFMHLSAHMGVHSFSNCLSALLCDRHLPALHSLRPILWLIENSWGQDMPRCVLHPQPSLARSRRSGPSQFLVQVKEHFPTRCAPCQCLCLWATSGRGRCRLQLRPQTGSYSSGLTRTQSQKDRLSVRGKRGASAQACGTREHRRAAARSIPWTQRCQGNWGCGASVRGCPGAPAS